MVGVVRQSVNIGFGDRSRLCWTIGLFSSEASSSVMRSFFLRCGGVLQTGVYVRGLLSANRFQEAMRRRMTEPLSRLNREAGAAGILFIDTISRDDGKPPRVRAIHHTRIASHFSLD